MAELKNRTYQDECSNRIGEYEKKIFHCQNKLALRKKFREILWRVHEVLGSQASIQRFMRPSKLLKLFENIKLCPYVKNQP